MCHPCRENALVAVSSVSELVCHPWRENALVAVKLRGLEVGSFSLVRERAPFACEVLGDVREREGGMLGDHTVAVLGLDRVDRGKTCTRREASMHDGISALEKAF